jgi:hypothetical protein
MAGDPVEINPSIGSGYRVMTAEEWASRLVFLLVWVYPHIS